MKIIRLIVIWGPFVGSLAGSFWLSSQTRLPLPPGTSDKLLHVVGYAGIALTAVRAFHGGFRRLVARATAKASGAVALYAIVDEAHQAFVPGRNPSLADIGADFLGIALAVVVLAVTLGVASERASRGGEAPTL